jgi:phosphatidylglycerophosphatase A
MPGAVAWFVATVAGVGYFPVASGTAGAAVGVAIFFLFAGFPLGLYALTVAALTALGVWAADRCEGDFGKKDDGRIVIDEVVGQLLTLAPLLVLRPASFLAWTVTGFVLFRVFDVWKPGPVRWLERNLPGGAGVVMDDVMAGVFAAMTLTAVVSITGRAG